MVGEHVNGQVSEHRSKQIDDAKVLCKHNSDYN